MLELMSTAEQPLDPLWLRTLSTVLPVVGAILVALLGAPKFFEAIRKRRSGRLEDKSPLVGVPSSVAVAATEKASTDPILKLFIDDLHTRLSLAHHEMSELHRLRSVDAGTIATLTTELADREERLRECESDLEGKKTQNRSLMRRLEELKKEVEATQRKLSICMEGHGSTDDRPQEPPRPPGPRSTGDRTSL